MLTARAPSCSVMLPNRMYGAVSALCVQGEGAGGGGGGSGSDGGRFALQ